MNHWYPETEPALTDPIRVGMANQGVKLFQCEFFPFTILEHETLFKGKRHLTTSTNPI